VRARGGGDPRSRTAAGAFASAWMPSSARRSPSRRPRPSPAHPQPRLPPRRPTKRWKRLRFLAGPIRPWSGAFASSPVRQAVTHSSPRPASLRPIRRVLPPLPPRRSERSPHPRTSSGDDLVLRGVAVAGPAARRPPKVRLPAWCPHPPPALPQPGIRRARAIARETRERIVRVRPRLARPYQVTPTAWPRRVRRSVRRFPRPWRLSRSPRIRRIPRPKPVLVPFRGRHDAVVSSASP